MTQPLLQDKVALISGGNSGIGLAIVAAFLSAGAKVLFLCTNPDKRDIALEQLRQILPPERQDDIQALLCNVANHGECQAAVGQILASWGKVDILVNNAGITRDGLLMRMTEQDWDDVLDVNLKSAFNLSQAVIRPMIKARKGAILNISSVIGLVGNEGQCNYSAAKSGMIAFGKSLAREVGSRNIRVNSIAPGFIETPMTHGLTEDLQKMIKAKVPLGRFGQTVEVANLAVFLASDQASYITGQTFAVDGGMTMQ
jgi:3-oxoacyl-[acyl-carrier protein] reductase